MYQLALMYQNGEGVIQNYEQAYAWASVATAVGFVGFQNKNSQKLAEQLRNGLAFSLSLQDQTGQQLKQAKALAQQYYDQYVTPTK